MTDDTPTRVLRAAGPIFAQKGYESATVREICADAGVNLASVNYHFRDKATLYLETVKLAHTLMREHVPSPTWPDNVTAEEKLLQLIKTMLERMLGMQDQSWHRELMMREMINPTHACKSLVEDFIRPEHNRLLEVLKEIVPGETPAAQLEKLAFSIVGQCLLYRVCDGFIQILISEDERNASFQIEHLAEHVYEFSLSALKNIPQSVS